MKRLLPALLTLGCLCLLSGTAATIAEAADDEIAIISAPASLGDTAITFPKIEYAASIADEEARITADIVVEGADKQERSCPLFEGELALLPPRLPAGLRIEREGDLYKLRVSRPGRYAFKVGLVAKVKRVEPWDQITFKGPPAGIASIEAQAAGADVRLLSGTLLTSSQSNGVTRVKGFLGGEQIVALRWSRTTGGEGLARKAVMTAETTVTAQITPTVIKYTTQMSYDVLQGKTTRLLIALPASNTLTRLVGEQIRDWEIKSDTNSAAPTNGESKILEVQFIKPLEKQYQLTVYSEQTVESTPSAALLAAPQPLEVERESGSFTLTAEDTLAEVESAEGLRQVNASGGALAAYRFNARPFTLALKLRRIEPAITVAERVIARVEETRLISIHTLTCNVEKAGVYALDLLTPPGFTVANVQGEGIEDWKLLETAAGGPPKLRVNFSNRVLGLRKLEVQLEQPVKTLSDQIRLAPLRVAGAARESSEVGAAAAAGIRLKTAEVVAMHEVPVRALQVRSNAYTTIAFEELLGYKAEQPDWKLTLTAERLAPRIVAEIFNLVTIGDGIVGGSATIRYGLLNQGVQEFEVLVPPAWKNVEFTGPNIRRKDQGAGGTWTIGLQDKVWGGYTLVVTYDYQFDPKGGTLAIGGVHTKGVERETGSLAITTATSLKLNAKTVSDTLRPIDEMELSPANRGLITRSVLLAYQYDEGQYNLEVNVSRFDEVNVLSAVADRTQLTTVLTDAGEMLTQASFMVKNNDKQFQRFRLAQGAKFWSCHVNGQPVKVERDGEWLMVPLPRGANRNQAFAVDLVFAETKAAKPGFWPKAFLLQAPRTDLPNTYAEWQLYAPPAYRLSGFAGNMTPIHGTTYDLTDAWQKFTRFYWDFLHESGAGLAFCVVLIGLIVALIASASRRGTSGVISVLVVFAIVTILAAMLLPALSRSKARAQRINGVNNLKQIGLAFRTWALDNGDRLPVSFEEMRNELGTDKITYDPATGQRYIYLGAGLDLQKIQPDSVIACSPPNNLGYRDVLLADGSVQQLSLSKFEEYERRGLVRPQTAQQAAENQQIAAVRGAQMQSAAQPLPNLQVPAPATAAQLLAGTPVPAGPRVRAIRIDIPREGQAFWFTKVLHLDNQPLDVQLKVMKQRTFESIRMALQLAAFLGGLVIWWWQWRRGRNSLILTVALALALCAVGSLLLAWRLLHLAFIWGAPVVLLAVLAWLTRKFWPRSSRNPAPDAAGIEPGMPPAVAAILLAGLTLACPGASLAAPKSSVAAMKPTGAPVSITSAAYTGTVSEHVAQIEALITVSADQPNQKVFLFGNDVAVQQFTSKSADARLVREACGIAVRVRRRGQSAFQVKMLIKLAGDVSKRQLAFCIPPSLTSQLMLTIDQPDADVEFPAAISVKRATTGQQTHLEAMIGSGGRVELFWTPRVKRAAEIAANVICQNATLVTVGGGVLNARAVFDYQVTQGEMRTALIRVPAGHRLLRVEGDTIRTWEIKAEGQEQVLQVELLKGVSPGYRLMLETEKLLGPLPTSARVEIPHATAVNRETGLVALRGDEELDLAVENTEELYRVDVEEFTRLTGQKPGMALNAFRFLKPDFNLSVRVAPMQPQIEAVLHNTVRVSPEQLNLTAVVDYTIKRAGVFNLRIALPDGYRLETVAGTNLLQNAERIESAQRILEITLSERTIGPYQLRLELSQRLKELPKHLSIFGVQPAEVQKLTGFLLVSVEPGVALKTTAFEGLTEISTASLDAAEGSGSALAYKFIATNPSATQPWNLAVETETVESWVRAEFVNTLTLSDTLVSGRAIARFDIQNAPVKELSLRIPEDFKNVEISGANIRRRDHAGEIWRIEFQSKIRGGHTLTITWDQPRTIRTNLLELRGVTAEKVERDTGVLAIVARPPLQVTQQSAEDLKRVDLRDLPEWAGQPEAATVLAYRYVRPGYKLQVEARRFAEAEVLQTLVETLNLSTVVADDGQLMTLMSLSVRNQGRQHLEIVLPAGATVWSAFVAGQAVRPSVTGSKLLLPLEHQVGDESAIPIELVYVDTSAFPKKRGILELTSPKLDAPLKSTRWELFLPSDYSYGEFGGTMAHETGTTTGEPSNFSFLDYTSRESQNNAELAKELKSELKSAKTKLSSGNVKEALADFNRARSKGDLATATNSETRQLEAELRRAQGNTLIEAQTAFSLSNGANQPQQQPTPGTPALRYDTASAEAQWTKLQQAQDLGADNVQPIRVNLPTRGQHHSFTQVLQTETGKPLVIRMLAKNTRTHGWGERIAGPLAGFLSLWIFVRLFTWQMGRKGPEAVSPV